MIEGIGDLALHKVPGVGGAGHFASIVFGDVRPENPSKGMLWIKCERPANGKIHVSHGEPSPVEDGDLWIRTYAYVGNPSPWTVARSGRLYVAQQYPNVVTLRAGGMWTGVEAELWDGTQWILVSIADYLYNEGIEFPPGWVEGYSSGTGSVSKKADHLYVYASGYSSTTFVTDQSINLSGVSGLRIDWAASITGPGGTSDGVYFIASNDKMGGYNVYNARVAKNEPFGREIDALNVSSLNGSYYIRVHTRGYYSDSVVTLQVYKVWLEY